MRKRIMLVEDHPLVREWLVSVIATQPDMCVVGEAASVTEALQKLATAMPDALIVDLSLPGQNGMELIKDIHVSHPALPMLVLSMHEEKFYAERALRAGARGYLMKDAPTAKIVEALQTVLRGDLYMSSELSGRLLQVALHARPQDASSASLFKQLSDREIQVFEGVGMGLSTRELGLKLGISSKTVETHRSHIKRKLGLARNNDFIHAAIRWMESENASKTVAADRVL